MNNLQKSRELAKKHMPFCGLPITECIAAVLEMAEWKDEQFLEEKRELLGLVNLIHVDEHNQTIIEDLQSMLTY